MKFERQGKGALSRDDARAINFRMRRRWKRRVRPSMKAARRLSTATLPCCFNRLVSSYLAAIRDRLVVLSSHQPPRLHSQLLHCPPTSICLTFECSRRRPVRVTALRMRRRRRFSDAAAAAASHRASRRASCRRISSRCRSPMPLTLSFSHLLFAQPSGPCSTPLLPPPLSSYLSATALVVLSSHRLHSQFSESPPSGQTSGVAPSDGRAIGRPAHRPAKVPALELRRRDVGGGSSQ